MSRASSIENKIFFSKYKADSKIGQGSFGNIYSAHNINNGELYALKFEKRNRGRSLLETETYILCYLKGEGIPFIKSYGFSGEFNILVMELLGKSLETLFQENKCKFSLKTVCMLGEQMISRLEYIHKKYILHRDIKPDNFTIGRGKQSHLVYLIDFGLSKKFKSSKGNHEHIKYNENKRLIGTARYASINALKGCEQGRRDDMEALGYVLMYFLKGNLPWQGLKLNKGDDRYRKIYEIKKKTTPEELCVGFPKQFQEYIRYTRNLSFEQEPDYNYLKKLLYSVMDKYEFSLDYLYDWGICKRKSECSENTNITINNNINKNDNNENNANNHKNNNNNNNNNLNLKECNNKNNIKEKIDGRNAINNSIRNINNTKKKKHFNINHNNNINGINISKRININNKRTKNNNTDSKFNNSFLPKKSIFEKKNKKKILENIKPKKNMLNSVNNNKNSLMKSSDIIKEKKNMLKNIHDSKILDTLLNESYLSDGAFSNESKNNNFKIFNNSHYKFLSELNSTSRKSKEKENKRRKKTEIKTIDYTKIANEQIKDKNCFIY